MTVLSYSAIDWLTFTVRRPAPSGVTAVEDEILVKADEETNGMFFNVIESIGYTPRPAPSHKPYSQAGSPSKGIVFMWSDKRGEASIEIQGSACRHHPPQITELARQAQHRITRIDLCADFETHLQPIYATSNATAESRQTITSPSGDTVYLGSSTSERYARIYRYAPPHERSKFLRVEIVYRREYAQTIANLLKTESVESIIKAEIDRMNLHADLYHAITEQPAEYKVTRRGVKTDEKKVLWLAKQVKPSLKSLLSEGYTKEELITLLGLD